MRRRLLALLVVAAVATLGSAIAGGKEAERSLAASARTASRGPGARVCPVPARFRGAFERAARETRLPLPLLVAVAYEESRMDPNARSTAGAHGLLQVLPSTASELKLDALDPHANVLAGARYLRQMFDRFGTTGLALAAYNAGPTAVARAGGTPTMQTLHYVANVQARWRSLADCT
jgi:peptidoglycan DL-endopeptidase CwlO